MKRLYHYFLYIIPVVAALSLMFSSCGSDEPAAPDDPQVPEAPGGDEKPGETPGGEISRTVLVYMVADNTLGCYGYDEADLAEMDQAVADGALGDSGRLLVYYSRYDTDNDANAPRLLEITPEGRKTLRRYDGDTHSTDAARMRAVIDDAKQAAPARQYGLVLWSHATAWLEEAASRSGAPGRTVKRSFGDDRGHKMRITSLAGVLEDHPMSFIYFDCCLMASVEALYELRHAASFIVATTTELPADGTNYRLSLPFMFADGEPDAVGIARATFDYYDATPGVQRTCTMSVIDTSRLDDLAAASRVLMASGCTAGKSRSQYQRFSSKNSFKVLVDMADYYGTLVGADPAALAAWREALAAAVVYDAATPTAIGGITLATHCGLSTLLIIDPLDADYMGYKNQAWWTDVVSHNPIISNPQ